MRSWSTVLKIFETIILTLLVALYLYLISHDFCTLPEPGDPLYYIGSISHKGLFWPWLDRISVAVGLRTCELFCSPSFTAGMVYIGFINTALLILGLYWAYSCAGFWAAFFYGLLCNSSYMLCAYATYVYCDQTIAFYSLLTFITLRPYRASSHPRIRLLLSGSCAALATFSKAPGIIVPCCALAYLVASPARRRLIIWFLLGLLVGTLLVTSLFVLYYDFTSLQDTINNFFGTNLAANIGRSTKVQVSANYKVQQRGNLVPYFAILLSPYFFPSFISLLVCISAYRRYHVMPLYQMSWAHILIIYLLCLVTYRAGCPFPHYIYPAFVYATLGIAIHLASFVQHEHDPWLMRLYCLVGILLLILGLHIGTTYPPTASSDFKCFFPLADIFKNDHFFNYPWVVYCLYLAGPLLVVGSIAWLEYWRSQRAVLSFILLVTFWSAAFNGGVAFQKNCAHRYKAAFLYQTAPVLAQVPATHFSIYVRSWNEHPEAWRILWVYRIFFDPHLQTTKANSRNLVQAHQRIMHNLDYIYRRDLRQARWPVILTDRVDQVLSCFDKVNLLKTIHWNHQTLFVVRIRTKNYTISESDP